MTFVYYILCILNCPGGWNIIICPDENVSISQGLELKIFHFSSAIYACAKSDAPDRDEVALRLFNDSRVMFF